MGHKISSTIVIETRGCDMKHKPKKHKKSKNKTHDHKYESKAVSDKNRLFHNVKGNQNGVQQNVNVEMKIEESEGCFEGLIKAFRGTK